MNEIQDARSGTDSQNLQEILDAAVSGAHALQGGQQQYQTPPWFAKAQAGLLPYQTTTDAYDPQCAGGNLLLSIQSHRRYGSDIDKRFESDATGNIQRIRGNCVRLWETAEDVYPDERDAAKARMKFTCILANPPFGIRWKLLGAADNTIDSTEWTWKLIKKRLVHGGCGYFIASWKTIEELGINTDKWVYLYQKFPAGGIWENCDVAIGVVHFINNDTPPKVSSWSPEPVEPPRHCRYDHTWEEVPNAFHISGLGAYISIAEQFRNPPSGNYFDYQWVEVGKILKEESGSHSKYNIFLNKDGILRTYLSTRHSMKMARDDVYQLNRINGCRPLTLTTEREARKILHKMVTSGVYTIEPEARLAILNALAEVNGMACPIRPVTPFERVAYAEEEDSLECIATDPTGKIRLTVGKRYDIKTGTYSFTERYVTKKLYYDEDEETTELKEHDCELHGQDRYIEIIDDRKFIHRFMDRPRTDQPGQHPEALLWDLFKEPYVPTVKEVHPEQYQRNIEMMNLNEMLNNFTYFPGQLDYYARMGCKDYGVIAADVGTGKTLGALTMIAMKSPRRSLIIAPQGTMRSSGDEDDAEEYKASQWVSEIRRFAPTEPVFQLFCYDDWQNVLAANGGELPNGVYISYPQAYFSNNAFEQHPSTWPEALTEEKFCKEFDLPFDKDRPTEEWRSAGVGMEKNGIRCIAAPCLHTQIAAKHGANVWDMVILDEAHLICNQEARITKSLLRVQPKYRFLMTATPIPNMVNNIFSPMGWVCVKDWYKGDVCNAAWPYTMKDIGRFETTFMSLEVDLTAQSIARAKGKKNAKAKKSPIISSPARLLKLLKPSMAYISKEDCNPNLQPCEVIDVRVKTGKQQSRLYEYWLNRGNYKPEFKSALTIAMVQSNRLRGVCAAPASMPYTRDLAHSNFNPKTVTILGLIRDVLKRGEQVVVVSARVGQSDEIAARLSEAKVPIARIDSTTAAELHTAEANRFKKGDARVMLMGIKCAQGHSFDMCPNLIVGSLEWSYGSLHQAKGRVWRLNSPKPVKVWVVLHKGTIEEVLFDRVGQKQDAATICLRGQRVPRDYKPFDSSEVLAEHIVNFDKNTQQAMSETECEQQWPELRKQLALAIKPKKEIKKDEA